MAAAARSDTHGGACGKAVGAGAVGARHARRRGREAAVGTPARGPDSTFKARVWCGAGAWQPRGDGTLTGGPGVGNGG
jgi:hypothetical protein